MTKSLRKLILGAGGVCYQTLLPSSPVTQRPLVLPIRIAVNNSWSAILHPESPKTTQIVTA